jgi:hypothetical protein
VYARVRYSMVANSASSNHKADRLQKISKARVDTLKSGEIAWDAEIRGFGMRCQRRDRVYLVKYRVGGRQRWFTIGKHGSPWTPELARREAKRVLGLVAEGKDPAEKKQKDRSAPTVTALAEQFLEEHVNVKAKDRTYLEYKRSSIASSSLSWGGSGWTRCARLTSSACT